MSISAVGSKKDGVPVIIIGVEEKNLEELRSGKPIIIPAERAGGTEVMIFYGSTMEELLSKSVRMIGPDTKVKRY